MSGRSVVIGLAGVVSVGLGLAGLGGFGSAALAQTPAAQERPGAAPPGTHGVPGTPPILRPEQIEKRIPPEEREKLGLPEAAWVAQHGKVHPDVRTVLETGQMPWLRFKGWEPIGFAGTAYVAIYLRDAPRHDAAAEEHGTAVKEIQARVLSRLTAANFAAVFLFGKTAGMLGYVDAEGLAKLAKDPDVLAVGLDDCPVPEWPPAPKRQPPPKSPPRGPVERRGKVELSVYEALEQSADGYVEVTVSVPHVPLGPDFTWTAFDAREAERRKAQDRVLMSLTAGEFRLKARSSFLDGWINASGLSKVADNADVRAVGSTAGPQIQVPHVTKRPD